MTKLRLIAERFRCPVSVTLWEEELDVPPKIWAAITEGKTIRKIPEDVDEIEVFEQTGGIWASIGPDKLIEPERKQLEVQEWRAQICKLDVESSLDYAVEYLANACRREFTCYRCLFLRDAVLVVRVVRILTWSLKSRARYYWLRLTGRRVIFRTFPGHNVVIYRVIIRAAVE